MTAWLKIGDRVMWRGMFGTDNPLDVQVIGIELTRGDKYGDSFDQVPWYEVRGRNVVVSLDNGRWAYGSQIERVTP